jgi:nitronate monooxygenase
MYKLPHFTHPIIQAPMAGGATTPELIATVSNLGGLGSLGAGYMQSEAITEAVTKIHQLTDKPYQANVFVAKIPQVAEKNILDTCRVIEHCAKVLELTITPPSAPFLPDMEQQIEALLKLKTPIISFTFGIPDKNIIRECIKQNRLVMGTATNFEEAQAWQEQGIDAVILQGSEAGGHRGTFLTDPLQSLYPIQSLFETCYGKIDLPLIVSGGITSATEVKTFIEKGATAVQIGTAFLCTDKAGIPEIYKQTLDQQATDHTVLTRAFSGKYARGIDNQFIKCMESQAEMILPYPVQNKISKQMRDRAKNLANPEFMSLWAGQSVANAKYQPVETLFAELTSLL